jgi:hypothetical protein
MKIEVSRSHTEDGNLVFTIVTKEPTVMPFTIEERLVLTRIDEFLREMKKALDPSKKLYQDILLSTHAVKENMLIRVINQLKTSINTDLRIKFEPICEEIFNWIYDNQVDHVRSWLSQFEPQRVKYYFDNDAKVKKIHSDTDFKIYKDEEDDDEDED